MTTAYLIFPFGSCGFQQFNASNVENRTSCQVATFNQQKRTRAALNMSTAPSTCIEKLIQKNLTKSRNWPTSSPAKLAAIGCALACYLIGGLEHVDKEVIGYHI